MKRTNMTKKCKRILPFLFFSFLLLGLILIPASSSDAATLKVKLNGKTSYYKKTQSIVKYQNKTITKSTRKGLTINGTRMVPYKDVFQKGLKVKTTYQSSKKRLTFSRNGVKVTLTVGSKNAYVNGKKYRLHTAPVSIRYVKKKTSAILVPAKFLCQHLGFQYKASKSTITITKQFMYSYQGKDAKTTQFGNYFTYNDKNNKLASMPIFKLSGAMYVPAEEVLNKIMGLNYKYYEDTQTLEVENTATNKKVKLVLNEPSININNISSNNNTPMYIVTRKDTKKDILCIPAKKVLTALGYSYKWDKKKILISAHDLVYFDWVGDSKKATDSNINYITNAKATYNPSIDCISFEIKGTKTEIMDQVTVSRNGKVISISIPKTSKYLLEQFSFTKFVSSIEKFEVIEDGNDSITINIACFGESDFAYSSLDGILTINIMGEYVGNYALKFSKPTGTTINSIKNEDLYQSKMFKIIIPGNHIDFYNQNPIAINSNVITSVNTELSNGNTVISVTTSKLQGYKIYEKSDSFVVSVGDPRSIYKNIVVLDAGHGGYDSGATNKGTKEKDLNHKIIYTLMKNYFSSNAPDTKVYWTRTSDVFITLAKRASFASTVGADIFVSLHMNSASSSSANGTEVYYSTNNNSSSFSGVTSKAIATLFKNNLVTRLGTSNRGVKTAGYYVTKHNTVPAVLIELGFLSGSKDYYSLTNSAFQANSAKVIYDTINEIFATYPTGR
ncbi:MAG: N-acetylmuramoyl-L-alanine amidase [Eubacterium sp.]|nr:N-acetylmuramoyl-L-alanine amidase [Eubacterium sp.]